MKKVLITGGNGLLGKRLRQLLESNNFLVIGAGLGRDRLLNHNHSYVELDVTNKSQCFEILNKLNPDFIVNAAAVTNVDYCEKKKEHCLLVNSKSIDYLNISKKRHFIQISTDFVFEGKEGPYSEESAPKPINYYGLSKYQAEENIIAKNWTYTILRTCLVYGESSGSNNIFMWVKNALKRKEFLKIVDDSKNNYTHSYILIVLYYFSFIL